MIKEGFVLRKVCVANVIIFSAYLRSPLTVYQIVYTFWYNSTLASNLHAVIWRQVSKFHKHLHIVKHIFMTVVTIKRSSKNMKIDNKEKNITNRHVHFRKRLSYIYVPDQRRHLNQQLSLILIPWKFKQNKIGYN